MCCDDDDEGGIMLAETSSVLMKVPENRRLLRPWIRARDFASCYCTTVYPGTREARHGTMGANDETHTWSSDQGTDTLQDQ